MSDAQKKISITFELKDPELALWLIALYVLISYSHPDKLEDEDMGILVKGLGGAIGYMQDVLADNVTLGGRFLAGGYTFEENDWELIIKEFIFSERIRSRPLVSK